MKKFRSMTRAQKLETIIGGIIWFAGWTAIWIAMLLKL